MCRPVTVKEESKCMGGIKSVLHNIALGMNIKRRLYEGLVPTTLYGAETWNVRESQKRLDIFEMRCLRSMVGVRGNKNGQSEE